ncbi:hypothetical protein J31TS4_03920 [Paenibacillus sp. J31TS4]|uniref:anti-sigma factor family protein n=1 Tax=Paenibacillus sp. J31TS4 TaxID=2807195 RepID=UPI001B271C64|nr:zf-HC2 domain-containing protein [Paenibacillus sp. J31TS4]GIP37112.1 hypothetical protein J31TS4_03920 [Paenibacillus sp. J31TS4]
MGKHIEDKLSAYLDDALTTDERIDVEEHMDSCAACSEAFREYVAVRELVRTAFHSVKAPERLEEAVMEAIRPIPAAKPSKRFFYGLAACLLSLLMLLAVLFAIMAPYTTTLITVGYRVTDNLLQAAGHYVSSLPSAFIGLLAGAILLLTGSGLTLKALLNHSPLKEGPS